MDLFGKGTLMDEPAPPAWALKRDGRLVPFEADKISRALFAAAEGLGHADAFLARELADAVVHFLTAEGEGPTPTTAQIAELTVKVVRELGQPALAEAFAEFGRRRVRTALTSPTEAPPESAPAAPGLEVVLRFPRGTPLREVLPACTRSYTLQTVYTRDLVSAQDDGLLSLTGLEHPDELAACVLPPGDDLVSVLQEVRRHTAGSVALDGPEHLLARRGRPEEAGARDFAHALVVGLAQTGLGAVVNLNGVAPPPWAGDLARGPLFADQSRPPAADHLRRLSDALLRHLLAGPPAPGRLRIDWHLGEHDFQAETEVRERLLRAASAALAGVPFGFVFDRPRCPVALAEGIDRQRPAVLLTVGLHLPRLAALAGMEGPTKFLQRLGSLARLALSAGVQKREHLRRQERGRPQPVADAPAVTSGFLLDRARLLVAPVGLDRLVQSFTGKGLSAGGAGLDFGRQVLQRLRDVLRQDGRASHLDCCLDGPFDLGLAGAPPGAEQVAGLTPWDGAAPPKGQLRAGGALHGVADAGTLALFLPADGPPTPEQLTEWLRTAWQQTDVVRLRLAPAS
jgi:hypothetical protein